MIHWYAFPIGDKRDGRYHRKVWTIFGVPVWWWDIWSGPRSDA